MKRARTFRLGRARAAATAWPLLCCLCACSRGSALPAEGFRDCDGDSANGAETDVRSSTLHCGGCAKACEAVHATALCVDGQCKPSCHKDWAVCGSEPREGCTVEIRGNVDHCGGCNRTCDLGPCVAGECRKPAPVASAIRAYGFSAADDAWVYMGPVGRATAWTRIGLADGKTESLSASEFIPDAAAGGYLVRCAGHDTCRGAAAGVRCGTCTLEKKPARGGPSKRFGSVELLDIGTLTGDNDAVYYSALPRDRKNPGATIQSMPLRGGDPTTVLTVPIAPTGIAVGHNSVFWTVVDAGRGEGMVMRLRRDRNEPTTVTKAGAPRSPLLHGNWLYFIDGDAIRRVSPDGGAPEVVLRAKGPAGIAIREHDLFFATRGSEPEFVNVWKVATAP